MVEPKNGVCKMAWRLRDMTDNWIENRGRNAVGFEDGLSEGDCVVG